MRIRSCQIRNPGAPNMYKLSRFRRKLRGGSLRDTSASSCSSTREMPKCRTSSSSLSIARSLRQMLRKARVKFRREKLAKWSIRWMTTWTDQPLRCFRRIRSLWSSVCCILFNDSCPFTGNSSSRRIATWRSMIVIRPTPSLSRGIVTSSISVVSLCSRTTSWSMQRPILTKTALK